MNTLFVDDSESLVTTIEALTERLATEHKHGTVNFFTTLKDARDAIGRSDFNRVIADQRFDLEKDDGINFLEEVRERRPGTELVLLTTMDLSSRQHEGSGKSERCL